MQVVIDIDENLYTRLFDNGVDDYDNTVEMANAIRKGIVLTLISPPIILSEDKLKLINDGAIKLNAIVNNLF